MTVRFKRRWVHLQLKFGHAWVSKFHRKYFGMHLMCSSKLTIAKGTGYSIIIYWAFTRNINESISLESIFNAIWTTKTVSTAQIHLENIVQHIVHVVYVQMSKYIHVVSCLKWNTIFPPLKPTQLPYCNFSLSVSPGQLPKILHCLYSNP